MPKPVYEQEDVTVLWNKAVHIDGDITVNRSDIAHFLAHKTHFFP